MRERSPTTSSHRRIRSLLPLGEAPWHEAWDIQRSLAGAWRQARSPSDASCSTPASRHTRPAHRRGAPNCKSRMTPRSRSSRPATAADRFVPQTGAARLMADPRPRAPSAATSSSTCTSIEEALGCGSAFAHFASRGRGSTVSPSVWLEAAAAEDRLDGVHVSRWMTTRGYALNVDLDPAPFTDSITACGQGRDVHDGRARARPAGDGRRAAAAAVAALEDVFRVSNSRNYLRRRKRPLSPTASRPARDPLRPVPGSEVQTSICTSSASAEPNRCMQSKAERNVQDSPTSTNDARQGQEERRGWTAATVEASFAPMPDVRLLG